MTIEPADQIGTPEHAAQITEDRHPGVQTALAWLCFSHLPPALRDYSRPFYETAADLIVVIDRDSAELTIALNKLVEAKDWAVRAGIRAAQGKPGPVPRPQTIVDPPTFGQAQVPARPDQQLPNHPDFRGPIDNRIGPNFGRPIQDRPQA